MYVLLLVFFFPFPYLSKFHNTKAYSRKHQLIWTMKPACIYIHQWVDRLGRSHPRFSSFYLPPLSSFFSWIYKTGDCTGVREQTKGNSEIEREREKEFDREQYSKHKNYTKTEKNHVMNYNVFLRCQGA